MLKNNYLKLKTHIIKKQILQKKNLQKQILQNKKKAAIKNLSISKLLAILQMSSYKNRGKNIKITILVSDNQYNNKYYISNLKKFCSVNKLKYPKIFFNIVSTNQTNDFEYPINSYHTLTSMLQTFSAILPLATIYVYKFGKFNDLFTALNIDTTDIKYQNIQNTIKQSHITILPDIKKESTITQHINTINNLISIYSEYTLLCCSNSDFLNDQKYLNNNNILIPCSIPYILNAVSSKITINNKNIITKKILLNQGCGGKSNVIKFNSRSYQTNVEEDYKLIPDLTIIGQIDGYKFTTYVNKFNKDKILSTIKSYNYYGSSFSLCILVAVLSLALQKRNTSAGQITSNLFMKKLYNDKQYLYANNIVTDIKSGKRGTLTATTNYDYASGLGSVNIPKFINYIVNTDFTL